MRLGETPVHIPNTMVKTQAAHGTMLETAWESRWLPDFKKGLELSWLERTPDKREVDGSSPFKPIKKNNNTSWGRSSVGRAPALQAGGQEFESLRLQSKSKDFINKDCTLKTTY